MELAHIHRMYCVSTILIDSQMHMRCPVSSHMVNGVRGDSVK